MKKIISMIALILVLALCFSACSGNTGTDGTTETTTESTAGTTSGTENSTTSGTASGETPTLPTDEDIYQEALALIASKDYESAYEKLESLGDYKDTAKLLSYFHFVPTHTNLNRVPDEQSTAGLTYDVEFIYGENNLLVEIHYIEAYTEEGITQSVASVIRLEYDEKGNITKISGSDAEGNLSNVAEYTYDENGNLIKISKSDAEGNHSDITEYTYDENGNLIKIIESDAEGNPSDITEYTYDENGNLTKEVYTNDRYSRTIEYTYDENGNLIKEYSVNTDGDRTVIAEYTYNENGHLIKRERGSVLEYTVDEHGNIIGATFSGGGDGTFVVEREVQLVYSPLDIPEKTEELLSDYYNAILALF